MMLFAFVGLTAIDVSLCGPTDVVSQSVFALAVVCVAVVQIAVPVFTAGPDPNVALGTGAGASIGLCVEVHRLRVVVGECCDAQRQERLCCGAN